MKSQIMQSPTVVKSIIKSVLWFVLVICLSSNWIAFASPEELSDKHSSITGYHAVWIPTYDQAGNLQIAIRMYYQESIPYFLLVNPYTFTTKLMPVSQCLSRKIDQTHKRTPGYYTLHEIENTPYVKALIHYSSPPYLGANDGLTHAANAVHGVFLTIDMCPSSKPFEIEFFKTLTTLSTQPHPIPIALSMSGLWMLIHKDEFNWLIHQVQTNKLAITWINHSFSHVYYRDVPFSNNFMLNRPSDFIHEILETEKILLQNRQLPSIYFRYPGLIANQELMLKLRELGLIPVGSDAWLAKGQQPKDGSIILVHGNSNEHAGIEDVLFLLKKSNLRLLPLQQAVGLTWQSH